MNIFEASSRYDKSKNPEKKMYRFCTLEECKQLSGHSQVIDQHGQIANVKITAKKLWKTRSDVQVSWKFGLYEYGKELITCNEDNKFFVVEVN